MNYNINVDRGSRGNTVKRPRVLCVIAISNLGRLTNERRTTKKHGKISRLRCLEIRFSSIASPLFPLHVNIVPSQQFHNEHQARAISSFCMCCKCEINILFLATQVDSDRKRMKKNAIFLRSTRFDCVIQSTNWIRFFLIHLECINF